MRPRRIQEPALVAAAVWWVRNATRNTSNDDWTGMMHVASLVALTCDSEAQLLAWLQRCEAQTHVRLKACFRAMRQELATKPWLRGEEVITEPELCAWRELWSQAIAQIAEDGPVTPNAFKIIQ